MKVRNVWIANLIAYGTFWLLLAGLSALVQAFWGGHFSLWMVTTIVLAGAAGDGLTTWLKKWQE